MEQTGIMVLGGFQATEVFLWAPWSRLELKFCESLAFKVFQKILMEGNSLREDFSHEALSKQEILSLFVDMRLTGSRAKVDHITG